MLGRSKRQKELDSIKSEMDRLKELVDNMIDEFDEMSQKMKEKPPDEWEKKLLNKDGFYSFKDYKRRSQLGDRGEEE